ncbi:MAG: hypothetical protein ACRCYX_10100 [Dermatophilaceae bacterium]
MTLDEAHCAAVELAGSVKARLVEFATSPPFERYLRQFARELAEDHPDSASRGVAAIEKLLFDFRYDDGTTVVHRFVRRSDLSEAEREMARRFVDGVEGFFEVLVEAPAGAEVISIRCCVSDLEHLLAPTEPAGMPTLPPGSFLAGRLNPVAGTELWTPSGTLNVVPASNRKAVADAVMQLALHAPWLTHRNPEKLHQAAEHSGATHERFVARHGSDLALVAGPELAEVYADAIVPTDGRDATAVAAARVIARRTIEDSELADADHVLVNCHPVAGFGFYQNFVGVARALESGPHADPDDVDLLRDYLDDPGVPSWVLRRVVASRLPAAEVALAGALGRPHFSWERDGEHLLASLPGDSEPTLTLAMVPSMCSAATPAPGGA